MYFVPTKVDLEAYLRVRQCMIDTQCAPDDCDAFRQNTDALRDLKEKLSAASDSGLIDGWRLKPMEMPAIVERGVARRWLAAIDAGNHRNYIVPLAHVRSCEEFESGCWMEDGRPSAGPPILTGLTSEIEDQDRVGSWGSQQN